MAVLKNLVAALALASYVSAVPLALVERGRGLRTVTETEWTTLDVTVTVYADAPKATDAVKSEAAPPAVPAFTTSVESVAPVATSEAAGQFAEEPKAEAVAPVEASQPVQPSVSVPEVTSAPVVAVAAVSTPAVEAAPAETSAAAAPVASASTGGSSGGSPSGDCASEGGSCKGDVTHWDGGLGACGWNVNTASDMQVALPVGLMGSLSNSNPYCGKSLTLKDPATGNTATATVGDKCMGCEGRAIDLTDALFNKLVPNGDGRVPNIEWWFN